MPTARVRAHAKINLALALWPPEPPGADRPGWHRIATWMHAVDLADDLLAQPLDHGLRSTWSCAWAPDAPRPGVVDWPLARDLAWRALGALERFTGRELPTRLVLRKRIPAGSGLGGGSADAAAALVAINRAWRLGLPAETLRAVGAPLGSDVPFFIDEEGPPRPALVTGFGEAIERTRRAAGEVLVLIPPFACPTGRVYGAFDGLVGPGHRARESEVRELAARAKPEGAALFNDLGAAACAVRPRLAEVIRRAEGELSRPVHVTGSGSTLFCLVSGDEAESSVSRLAGAVPGVRLLRSRLI